MEASDKRLVAWGGLLFFVIVAVASFLQPNTPSTNATATKVVAYYHSHQAGSYITAYLIVLAVIVGLGYFWYLHEHLAEAADDKRLLTVGFAGAIVFAVSGAVSAGLKFALADGGHAGNLAGSAMQAFNLLEQDLLTPLTAAGTATFLIFTGLAVIRSGGLPRWLGWVGIVFGVISATGLAGPIGAGLWILIASIVMLVRSEAGTAGPPASSPAAQTEGV